MQDHHVTIAALHIPILLRILTIMHEISTLVHISIHDMFPHVLHIQATDTYEAFGIGFDVPLVKKKKSKKRKQTTFPSVIVEITPLCEFVKELDHDPLVLNWSHHTQLRVNGSGLELKHQHDHVQYLPPSQFFQFTADKHRNKLKLPAFEAVSIILEQITSGTHLSFHTEKKGKKHQLVISSSSQTGQVTHHIQNRHMFQYRHPMRSGITSHVAKHFKVICHLSASIHDTLWYLKEQDTTYVHIPTPEDTCIHMVSFIKHERE